MNSKNSARASVNFEMFDALTSCYSTLIAPTQRRSQSQRWKSSVLTSFQNFPRGAMPELMQRGSAQFASITGRYAHSITIDKYGIDPLQELTEMCNQCNAAVEATENKTTKLVAEELFINTKGLSMAYTEAAYAEGDVFFTVAPIHDPSTWLTAPLRNAETFLLSKEEQEHFDLQVMRAVHYGYLSSAAELNLMRLHGVGNNPIITNPALSVWCETLEYAFNGVYKPENRAYAERWECNTSVEEAAAAAESILAVKVHPKAVAMLSKIITLMERGEDVTGGDLYCQGLECMLCTLMQLHSYYVNRGGIWVGAGFKDGNPMVVLAKSVFKDGQFQGWILQEQRFGKFIQSVVGPKADARKEIDDLKVLNKAPVVHLCYTEQEWYDAYQAGPSSCMTGFEFDCSPVRVYATGAHGLTDNNLRLCISYAGELFGDNFKVLNRAIVNIKTMEYVRAYGDNADAIMRSLGYEHNTEATDGCTLRKLPHPDIDGAYLMPYLDGSQDEVKDRDDYWVIVSNGDYSATDPDGYIFTNHCRCSECGDSFDRDEMQEAARGDTVCVYCADNEYCIPYDHCALYRQRDCTWSEHMQEWILNEDLTACDVAGYVHDSWTIYQTVQGYDVIEKYTECRGDAYYLTEEACDILSEEYIPESDEEQEEAA